MISTYNLLVLLRNIAVVGFLCSCQHRVASQQAVAHQSDHFALQLKPMADILKYKNRFLEKIVSYQDSQLVYSKADSIDFSTEHILIQPPGKESLLMEVATLSRTGTRSLTALGFPEVDKRLIWQLSRSGQVEFVNGVKTQDQFSIPYLPLPTDSVTVGETWGLSHQWSTQSASVPLHMELGMVLQSVRRNKIAHVLVSGGYGFFRPTENVDFKGQIHGEFLFDMESGQVIHSIFYTTDRLSSDDNQVTTRTCLESVVKQESKFKCQLEWEDFPKISI